MRRSFFPFALLALAIVAPSLAATSGCMRTEASASVDAGGRAIVFIKRQHTRTDNGRTTVDVAGGNTQVLDYQRYVPGGSLNIMSPANREGVVKNITVDFPQADFNGADVSFDARQVVFSMKRDANDRYHIYTAEVADVEGRFELHQKTNGPYDDVSPIYIPGGRIAFVTNEAYTPMGTRADEYEHAREVTQLATISVEGGDADRRRASQNLSHTVAPFLRGDGRIGYSRWEHLGPVNDVKILAANPDGTQMVAVAGQHGKPSNALFSVREVKPNVMIAVATTRDRTIHAGALVRVDARNQADPACMDDRASKAGHACLDEENVRYDILTPDVPTSSAPSPVGRYREPSMLPDGRILVSFADGPVNDQSEQSATPPNFGVYIFDEKTRKNLLLYDDPRTWDLGALPVARRPEPPVLPNVLTSNDTTLPVRIGSINLATTSLKESVTGAQFDGTPLDQALGEAVKVRVIEGFSSEATKGVSMFGLTMEEGAAMLGEADVYADRSWLAEIPPYVPVHLQPIDKFGLSIRNQRLWIQGLPGEDRRCIGCHEGRTGGGVPRFGQNPTVAEQRGAQRLDMPVADRVEYPWASTAQYPATNEKNVVQRLLTAKCVSCHGGGAGDPFAGQKYTLSMTDPATGKASVHEIPILDLSDREITVVYDRQPGRYPVSYVSLFYPSAMDMGTGKTTVTGKTPIRWAIPTNARGSALVKKLNVKAADGTFAFQPPVLHPEDKGTTLTPEERAMLIRSIDMGGQFYARQNTDFKPIAKDPVGGR